MVIYVIGQEKSICPNQGGATGVYSVEINFCSGQERMDKGGFQYVLYDLLEGIMGF